MIPDYFSFLFWDFLRLQLRGKFASIRNGRIAFRNNVHITNAAAKKTEEKSGRTETTLENTMGKLIIDKKCFSFSLKYEV